MATLPRPQVTINLIGKNISRALMASTDQLRTKIISLRAGGRVDQITYQANVPNISAFLINSHVTLSPTETGAKTNYPAVSREVNGAVNLTISTRTLYPYKMGFVKANNKVDEAFHVFINQEPFTYVGIRYLATHQKVLGQMLPILVSEQIRFNTLHVFNQNFYDPQYYDASWLHATMHQYFKTPVYNKWTENTPAWPRSIGLTIGAFKTSPVIVNRLLEKI